jgi:hypothetical protein
MRMMAATQTGRLMAKHHLQFELVRYPRFEVSLSSKGG